MKEALWVVLRKIR